VRLSFLIRIRCALTSVVEVLIPTPYQRFPVALNKTLNPVKITSAKTSARLQPHWIKPELSSIVIALNVHVLRFDTVTCVEEEPVRHYAQIPSAYEHGIATLQDSPGLVFLPAVGVVP
jgi:hypothetical protein